MNKITITFESKPRRKKPGNKISAFILGLREIHKAFVRLWESTLASNMYSRDKAELLRLVIIAVIIITQTAFLGWLFALVLNHL